MKLEELTTIDQLSQFLDGTQSVIFKLDTIKKKRYQWIQRELVRFDYMKLCKLDKGIMKRYLIKVTSYSRAQVTRLIKQYSSTGYIKHKPAISNGFTGKYTNDDIRCVRAWTNDMTHPVGKPLKNSWSALMVYLASRNINA